MTHDPFEKVPEFLAAFNNIMANGFFENLKAEVMCSNGNPFYCLIQGEGLVPNDPKYAASGAALLVDPNVVIKNVRELATSRPPKMCHVKVETRDWPLWDSKEEKRIGSRGISTSLSLHIQFI